MSVIIHASFLHQSSVKPAGSCKGCPQVFSVCNVVVLTWALCIAETQIEQHSGLEVETAYTLTAQLRSLTSTRTNESREREREREKERERKREREREGKKERERDRERGQQRERESKRDGEEVNLLSSYLWKRWKNKDKQRDRYWSRVFYLSSHFTITMPLLH